MPLFAKPTCEDGLILSGPCPGCVHQRFDWDGTTYPGTHEPLVTRECWQRVQELLDARAKNKIRKMKHDFAYSGLVPCGHCGCLLVGELKKGKYVYGRGLWCLLISSH